MDTCLLSFLGTTNNVYHFYMCTILLEHITVIYTYNLILHTYIKVGLKKYQIAQNK